jgi:hypothetical protein
METTQFIVDKITPLFEKVSATLGEGAKFSWATIVKQQYVIGAQHLFHAFICLIGIIFLTYIAYTIYKTGRNLEGTLETDRWGYKREVDTSGYYIGASSMLFGIIPLTIGFSNLVSEAFGLFMNPDFYALQYVLSLVK